MVESDVDIDRLFEPGSEGALAAYVRLLHPADIASLFDMVESDRWTQVTRMLAPEDLGEVLANLDEAQREELGEMLATDRLIEVVEELETDDAADVLADLPEDKSAAVLEGLEAEDREDITRLLSYPEDSAGGIMQTELCVVSQGSRVQDAIEAVRKAYREVDDVLEVYVVDAQGRPQGTVALEDLVITESDVPLSQITEPLEHQVTPEVDQEEVAQLFRKYDLASLPVVGPDGAMLGRITFDDIHDVLEEEASEDIMAMAGASTEELVYSGQFVRIALLRLPWLLSSLVGALLTTRLVPLFSQVPAHTLILTAFVPVVMAMTGNVGSQSAMIITRGFAIGKVDLGNLWRTMMREMTVGVIMGVCAGLVVGAYAQVWQGNAILGAAVSLSVIASMSAASLIGVVAPAVFKRIGIDPAIAAGPLVTTACDVLGISIYLVVAILVLA